MIPWFKRVSIRFSSALLVTLLLAAILWSASAAVALLSGIAPPDFRGALLAASLSAISLVSYVAWPSLKNVPAHLLLAFSFTAYVVPLVINRQLETQDFPAADLYTTLCAVGAVAVILGSSIGAELPTRRITLLTGQHTRLERLGHISRRSAVVVVAGLLGLAIAFLLMGFIPALASDPLDAKFLRGPYAASYTPVAPLYRLSTALLIALLPLIAMFAMRRRSWIWRGLLALTVVALVLTLQRGAAIAGVLLFVGAAVAPRKLLESLFMVAIVIFYTFGSVSYLLLGMLGLHAFGSSSETDPGIWIAVQHGAPDVYDHLTFLGAWTRHPEITWGATILGGLVPGHFSWNPAVWTLHVANPGANINELTSGGLRLPPPVWGLVDFGWPGVVGISLLSGLVTGYLTALARAMLARLHGESAIVVYVLWSAAQGLLGQFFTLSYQAVLQTIALLCVVYLGRRTQSSGRGARRSARSSPSTMSGPNLESHEAARHRAHNFPEATPGAIAGALSTRPGTHYI